MSTRRHGGQGVRCRHCGRDVPWGTLFCPHCGAHLRTRFAGWTLYLVLLGIVSAVVVIWLAEFLSAQHRPPNREEWLYLPQPMNAVSAFLAGRLPNASELRLEPRGNYNLQIYLGKSSFLSAPPADRDEFLKGVLKAWCGNIPPAAFVPFVQIRDIRTGEELATGRCGKNW